MIRTVDTKIITENVKEMCIEANHYLSKDMDIRENIAGIRDSQEYLCQREPAVSVLARLQNAAQEVRECPAAEKPVRDFGAR